MNQTAIFWPMIAHVVLVYLVYALLGMRRYASVRTGEARIRQFKNRGAEPESSATASNNVINQFELPMLFHIACLALYVTNGVSFFALLLAWLFIVLRYIHAFAHVTTNKLKYRSTAFQAGLVVLGVLWAWFALHLLAVV